MILRAVALSLFGLFCSHALAAPLPPPADLPSAIQRQVASRETLRTQAEEGQAALHKWYESSLDVVRADAASKANLDTVLATDAERGRMDRDLSAAELAALPKPLRDLRVRYDQARMQRLAQFKAALVASLREYALAMDGLEKSLTRKLEIEGAVAARKERAAAADEISALSVPGAVVSLGGTATAAVSPAAPVRSGPAVPEPVKVASELKAYGTIQAPAPNAIAFEMPRPLRDYGPPADGGRGVLLKSDPKTGWNGSIWSVNWTYSQLAFYGLTFIHPFGAGHVMVRLRLNRLEPVSRNGWELKPLIASGSLDFFKPGAEPAVFPLQPNRKYAVVAQLDARGHYSLSIDGQVVGTAEYGSPDSPSGAYVSPTPLTLPEGFKGEGLPMKWEAGYAGLFVWPTGTGALNLCEDITFQTGVPALAQAASAPATSPRPVVPPAVGLPPMRVIPPASTTPPGTVASIRPTPEPIHASSMSASNIGTAPVLAVASELRAGGTIQNPAKDAIPFELPPGPGRNKGGRGVLIKNDPSVGRRGSTWSYQWASQIGNNGVSVIHPFGSGYVVIHIGASGAGPTGIRSFQSDPLILGSNFAKILKETPAAEIFPLKLNQKYQIVSQFDAKGHYTLTIDGKVVQEGSFKSKADEAMYVSPTAMALPPGFQGENLPMKWKAGYAALMVNHVYDSGISICENITFQGSAPLFDKPAR